VVIIMEIRDVFMRKVIYKRINYCFHNILLKEKGEKMRNLKKSVKNISIILCALVFGFSLTTFTATAFAAGTAKSDEEPYTVHGYSYKNYSTISVGVVSGQKFANAQSSAYNTVSTTVPAGYIASKGRLYNSAGSLVSETTYSTNSNAVVSHASAVASHRPATYDGYYSQGITGAFNGNGYTYYTTYRSPTLNP